MEYRPGDIIAFNSPGWVSRLIRWGTFGDIAHVGVIARYEGRLLLFESTTLAAGSANCAIQKRPVQGVQAHELSEIAKRPGKIYHYALVKPLTERQTRRLTFFLVNQIGKKYDYRGAGLSGGGFFLRMLGLLLRKESLDAIFCSELCAACFSRLLLLPTKSASVYNPVAFLRRARRHGVLRPRTRVSNAA